MCVTGSRECIVVYCGRVPYLHALELQMKLCEIKKAGFSRDVLLLLEHPPTITLGRNASHNHLLVNESALKSRGIGLFHIDRGGDITFHGPGQLVGYPILFLQPGERDVHRYMRNLEESLIRLLKCYDITGGREEKFTGVWNTKGKLAAMGVHISRWITRHGFALNVNTDLSFYDLIVPCGIAGRSVTSMQSLLSRPVDISEVTERYIPEFSEVFKRKMVRMNEQELAEEIRAYGVTPVEKQIADGTVV
ncbi:MAG: lipoyl(octanoyl) transferase LipB [Acidobacteria bacterium]|nr:lipoyl(octanoyl) transferase LipB [Acidobacteriota bacterium]